MTELVEPALRILPREIERLAAMHPNSTWMTSPMDNEQARGWRDITYLQLSHAVNGLALWAEEQIGEGNQEDVVAYIGANDELYGVVHIGLMKAGYKTMLPSTRNSPQGQAHLVRSTSCKTLLCSAGVESLVEDFRKAVPTLRILQAPPFDDLCDRGSVFGHYRGHYDDSPGFETLILHTSGSTGLPKPIRLTNASLSVIGNLRDLPCPYGRELAHAALFAESKPLFVMTPFFHAMGSIMMMRSIFYKAPIVRLPTGKVPNAELVTRVLEQMKPFAGIFAPALLEQVVNTDSGLEILGKLDYVFYGGAPLAKATGDKICKHTRLVSIIGSTEMGLLSSILPTDPKNWEYLEWSTAAGVHMESEGGGPHEMVIRPANALAQATFLTFPGSSEWRTQDLWERHPLDPNLWRYKGRKDDVLVLSNGEKLNPVSFEKALESHSMIHGAIVVGQGRFQTGVLIEPLWDLTGDLSASELLNELWPEVQRANAEMPSHGRVFKSKIAFATRDKPFKRAAKGSIIRNQAIGLYSQEIEAMYSHDSDDEPLGTLMPNANIATTIQFLRHVLECKGISVPIDAPDNANIFGYGIDSLQVLALVAALNQACDKRVAVSPKDIYQHPSMEALASLLSGNAACSDGDSREEMMTAMAKKYTHDLPEPLPSAVLEAPKKHTVILTGSTGSLGNSILAELIESPEVERIYCFNRSADARARQQSAFEGRGATPDFSKVTFLHTDFGTDRFGLELCVYKKLLETVTVFIHNAWTVDFNQSLQTYEAIHIAGTRRCVDFGYKSRYKSHIVFISSVASLGNWKVKNPEAEFAPENRVDDHQVPSPQGYAESKHVASLILAAAATSSGVPSTIIRCGQLAGPKEKGQIWNKHEWLPSIVLSSSSMGVMPGDLGNMEIIDWVPIDLAAKSVVEIANSRVTQVWQGEGKATSVSHIANPSTVTWTSLVPSIRLALEQKTGKAQTVLPFAVWLNVLSSTPRTPGEAKSKPGIMLLDFYESLISKSKGLPRLETRETAKLSKTIATMEAVNASLTTRWINEWFE